MYSPRFVVGVLGAFAFLGTAAPTPECCTQLSKIFPKNVFTSGTATWTFENNNFWSATEVLDPTCVFLPESTEHVSQAIKLFTEHQCKFSIKGGGHSAIPGAANINDGILMAMARINSTDINFDQRYIRAGAGLLLGRVYEALDPHNLTTIIGRYEKVGLGLGVGAGISFFSNREGLTVDNVLNYEVVLAGGEVVNANSTSNPDLFWALRGGNNNFGVVTHYHLRTLETSGAVYGGLVYYPEESLDQVEDVVYDYHTRQAVDDVLTHAMPQYGFNGTTNETINFTPVVYNDAIDQLPEVLQPWLKIPHTKSTIHKRTYSDLAIELNHGFADGAVQEQRVFTVYADADFYKDVWWRYRQWFQKYRDIPGFYGLHVNMPITPRQVSESVEKGGNALGLEGTGNRTLGILYFGVSMDDMTDVPKVLPDHDEFVRSMEELAKSRGVFHPYKMLTYSGYNQEAIKSYGEENVARLLEVAAKYDPGEVFQRLVPGGQKLPRSSK